MIECRDCILEKSTSETAFFRFKPFYFVSSCRAAIVAGFQGFKDLFRMLLASVLIASRSSKAQGITAQEYVREGKTTLLISLTF
jgi:hypothetical protein